MSDFNHILAIIISGLLSQALFVRTLKKFDENKVLNFSSIRQGSQKFKKVKRIDVILTILVMVFCLIIDQWFNLGPIGLGILFGFLSSFIHFLFPYQEKVK